MSLARYSASQLRCAVTLTALTAFALGVLAGHLSPRLAALRRAAPPSAATAAEDLPAAALPGAAGVRAVALAPPGALPHVAAATLATLRPGQAVARAGGVRTADLYYFVSGAGTVELAAADGARANRTLAAGAAITAQPPHPHAVYCSPHAREPLQLLTITVEP